MKLKYPMKVKDKLLPKGTPVKEGCLLFNEKYNPNSIMSKIYIPEIDHTMYVHVDQLEKM